MNSIKYKKMDKFVNEMNQSVNVVGDMSIYLFNRFRNFVGYLFITITTVAISFIVAEFVRGFEFSPIAGLDVYYIALFVSLVVGLYIAFYGEEAKIATIKGAIFSSGSNRTWQAAAALAIILVLIIVNAKGVQKIAEFSLRYMNTELQESVVFKLKEKKMLNHAALASTNLDLSSQDSALKALFQTRTGYEEAKRRELRSFEQAYNSYISGRDPNIYRTYIANKKLEYSRQIAKVENKWAKKMMLLDKRIAKAQERLNRRIDRASKMKQAQISEADKATEDLIKHYKRESTNNSHIIDMYKDIGLIVAIGGEIVDGLLAFLLFMIVKSNPNVNGTPQVQPNTRKMMRMKSYDEPSNELESQKKTLVKTPKKESGFVGANNTELSDKLFLKIKKVAAAMSSEYIKVGRNHYLKHPSQRELIKAFSEYDVVITPHQISQYFTRMGDEIMFVNQRLGFVYTQNTHKSAA